MPPSRGGIVHKRVSELASAVSWKFPEDEILRRRINLVDAKIAARRSDIRALEVERKNYKDQLEEIEA